MAQEDVVLEPGEERTVVHGRFETYIGARNSFSIAVSRVPSDDNSARLYTHSAFGSYDELPSSMMADGSFTGVQSVHDVANRERLEYRCWTERPQP